MVAARYEEGSHIVLLDERHATNSAYMPTELLDGASTLPDLDFAILGPTSQ
jgi:hypothetical protein